MNNSIRILLIEISDSNASAGWIGAGFPEARMFCVETMAEFKDAFNLFKPEIILSEYRLPDYDGAAALEYSISQAPDVPFIFLTDMVEDVTFAECMRAGAWNVICKNQQWRTLIAIKRYIRQNEIILQYHRTLEALRESEERYRHILEMAPVAIAIHSDGLIRYINPAGVKLLGAESSDKVIGLPISRIVPPDAMDATLNRIRKLVNGEDAGYPAEDDYLRLDGTPRHVEIIGSLLKYQDQTAIQVILMDITERKKAEEDYKYLSYHDYLTGLYNRRFFEEEVRRVDKSENLPVTIIIGDVDGLKQINDTLGHDTGDAYIVKSAEAMLIGCCNGDIAARIGGDEFALILQKTDEQAAEKIISTIISHTDVCRVPGTKLSISMGYATKKTPDKNISEIMTEAENNMYKFKRAEGLTQKKGVRHVAGMPG